MTASLRQRTLPTQMQWHADRPLILDTPPTLSASLDHAQAALQQLGSFPREETWAGYFGYDLGRLFEVIPDLASDDMSLPVVAFSRVDAAKPQYVAATSASPIAIQTLRSTFTRSAYLDAVHRCIEYIAAGDVFQINLSQRFTALLKRDPLAIFNELQQRFPARYPAYLDFGDHQIISNSPELFLKIDRLPDGRRRIVNRPIKGTRPLGGGMKVALERSEKDRAELAMIVDLQRNDLGRICEIGTVQVTEPRLIETHPTVFHGVATVEGILRESVTLSDILRATFPCGSITGCPKIRAMEIIESLEPVRRGVYCGAIGWIKGDGTMELSVAIRTMTIRHAQVHIPVGGGIVADSVAEEEYAETLVKAQAMFAAAGVKWEQE